MSNTQCSQQTSEVSDMDLVNRMYPIIKRNEQFKSHPYFDTKWFKTTGPGINISNPNLANSLNWRDQFNPSCPATQQQINTCWANLNAEKERIQRNLRDPKINNYTADYFEPFCNIRVSEEDMKKEYTHHMMQDFSHIRKHVPNFDNLDPSIQNVVMDRMYNMGATKFALQKNFLQCANNNDRECLINEASTAQIGRDRREWIQDYLKIY